MGGVAEPVLGRGLRGDDDLVAGVDLDLGVALEQTGADLGALGVEQDADGLANLGGAATDALDATLVLLVGAVGEVEAGDVHARLDHLANGLVVVTGGTHGANNLGAFKFLLHSDLHLMSLIGVVGKQIHGHIIEKEKPYIVVKRPHADSFHMALDL